MYPADTSFWVGYGFAAEHGSDGRIDEESTRFELDVDGEPVSMLTDVHSRRGAPGAQDEHRAVPGRPSGGLARLHGPLVRRRPSDPLESHGDPVRRSLTCAEVLVPRWRRGAVPLFLKAHGGASAPTVRLERF